MTLTSQLNWHAFRPPWRGCFHRFSSFSSRQSALLAVLLCLGATQSIRSEDEVGVPWSGPAGLRETTGEIMARDHQEQAWSRGNKMGPKFRPDFQDLKRNPGSPDVSVWPPPDSGATATNGGAQGLSVSFTGATLADTHAYPPDSMGTVGPAQYIVAVNGRLRSFDKNTGLADGVLDADMDVFFNSVMTPPANNNFTSDPRIRYDRLSGRWFIIMIDVPGQSGALPNRIMLAASDGSIVTANTVWTFFQFQQDLVSQTGDTGKFADYPTLGVDANALYIGVNIFGTRGSGTFSGTTAFVVRKSSVLGNGPIVVTAFRNVAQKVHNTFTGLYTPQGVDNFDPSATEGYLIGVDAGFYGTLQLRRITNPGGTPSISGNIAITIPLNGATINVPHLGNTGGTAGYLDGLDYRLLAAHIRNGRLWTSANLAVDNTGSPSGTDTRMAVRWYELQGIATGQTPSVVQSGTIYQPSASNTTDQRSYWMGTVMVSGQGHAAIGFSVAGVNEYANAGIAGRLVGDTLGTMRTSSLYTASSTAYNPRDSGGSPINRWGDYSYTSLDPSDDMTMWTIQEFCDSVNSYGVRVIKLLAPPPATPSSLSPALLSQGAANVNVIVVGTPLDQSGFFDPGTGFSNRLAASVAGGGVTVNSVTYSNPTHVTLNLTVAPNADPGARSLTITNPDGQSVTATNLLTVDTNHFPVLSAISDKSVNEQSLLSFANSATDTETNQTLTFSLDPGSPSGASINSTNGMFSWTPTEAQGPGTYPITVRVTDNGSPALGATRSFNVTVSEVNVAPTIDVITNRTVNEGTALSFTATASDSDVPANSLAFSLAPGAPAGAAINSSSGLFTWTPTESQGPSTNNVTVIVTDNGSPPLSASNTFVIIVNEVNTAPILTVPPTQTVNANTTLIVTNTATDVDLPTNHLAFTLVTAPTGAVVNASSGVLTWTPAGNQAGTTNTITVRVTDDGSPPLSDTKSFVVIVPSSNTAPVLSPISDQTVQEGTTIVVTNSATDADVPTNTLTFSLAAGTPEGATIDPASGILTWTPPPSPVLTTNTLFVRVTDDGAPPLSDTKSFNVVVVPSPRMLEPSQSDDGTMVLAWQVLPGGTYRVQFKESLLDPTWLDLTSNFVATGATYSTTNDISQATERFFRLLKVDAP
jgi:hypothetical protein